MYKLAMCDDDALFMEDAEKMIQQYNNIHRSKYGFQINKYVSPQQLLDDLTDGSNYDIFLLDMEMPEMSGTDLAKKIREMFPNAVIVFLSSHTEFQFAQEGYKVQAIRYVSKSMMDTTLPEALETAIKLIERSNSQHFVFSYYSEVKRIPYANILYIQKIGHMVVIHTDNEREYQMKAQLKDIYKKLNDIRFAYVDQSTIVNLDRVIRLAEHEITLAGERKLPVSRKMLPSLKASLLRLWGELV